MLNHNLKNEQVLELVFVETFLNLETILRTYLCTIMVNNCTGEYLRQVANYSRTLITDVWTSYSFQFY